MKKLLILLSFGLVLLILIFYVFNRVYKTPTSQLRPTIPTDWTTYENSICNYQISFPMRFQLKEKCLVIPGTPEIINDCIQTPDFDGGIGVTVAYQLGVEPKGTAIAISCMEPVNYGANEDLINECNKAKSIENYLVCEIVELGNTEFVKQENNTFRTYSGGLVYTINIEPRTPQGISTEVTEILNTFTLTK